MNIVLDKKTSIATALARIEAALPSSSVGGLELWNLPPVSAQVEALEDAVYKVAAYRAWLHSPFVIQMGSRLVACGVLANGHSLGKRRPLGRWSKP